MRVVGINDYVTWGSTARAYRVVSVVDKGLHLDGDYCNQGIFLCTWVADGDTVLRHVDGDIVDVLGSIAARSA